MLHKLQNVEIIITAFQDGVFRAISSLVACLGVYIAGYLINNKCYPYKWVLLSFTSLDIVIWIFFWKSFEFSDFWIEIFVRSLSGISCGSFCFLAPQYINKFIVPPYEIHFKMFSTFGIALGIFLGQFLAIWLNNDLLIAFGCAISILMGVLVFIFFNDTVREQRDSETIFQKKYTFQNFCNISLQCLKQCSGVNTLIVNLQNIINYANLPFPAEFASSIASLGLFIGIIVFLILSACLGDDKVYFHTLTKTQLIWVISICGSVVALILGAKDSPSRLPGCPFSSVSSLSFNVPEACDGPVSIGIAVDIFLFFVFFTLGMWILTTSIVTELYRGHNVQAQSIYLSVLFNCFFVFLIKLLSSFLLNYRYLSTLAFWGWLVGSLAQGGFGWWVMNRGKSQPAEPQQTKTQTALTESLRLTGTQTQEVEVSKERAGYEPV